jgi:hypothetical protein
MSTRIRHLCKIAKRRDGREGTREILRHILKSEVNWSGEHRNETGIEDRVTQFETNLPHGFDRASDPTLLAHALGAHKRNKAAREVWHIVLSAEDDKGDHATLVELRNRFFKHFGINAYWVACTHEDHAHTHMHVAICNADLTTGKPYDFMRQEHFKCISTLGFAEGMPGILNAQGTIPFKWRKSTIGEGMSRKGSYANVRKGNSMELAQRIKDNPSELLAGLIMSKEVEAIYSEKGAVSFRYKKTKFSLRDVNYFLKQAGSTTFLDVDLSDCDSIPVYISPSDLKDLEHDMACLAKMLQPQLHKVATSQTYEHMDKDIVTELLGLFRYRRTMGKMASGPLGWFVVALDMVAGIADLDQTSIIHEGRGR